MLQVYRALGRGFAPSLSPEHLSLHVIYVPMIGWSNLVSQMFTKVVWKMIIDDFMDKFLICNSSFVYIAYVHVEAFILNEVYSRTSSNLYII